MLYTNVYADEISRCSMLENYVWHCLKFGTVELWNGETKFPIKPFDLLFDLHLFLQAATVIG